MILSLLYLPLYNSKYHVLIFTFVLQLRRSHWGLEIPGVKSTCLDVPGIEYAVIVNFGNNLG